MPEVRIDRNKCKGHGHCAAVAPEFFVVRDGKAVSKDGRSSFNVAASDVEKVKPAALVCPEYAIDIVESGKSLLGISPGKSVKFRIIRASYDSASEWKMDPSGFFTIKPFPAEGLIRVRFYNAKHQLEAVIEGRSAEEIYNTIIRECLVSMLSHAAYLGSELQKAELAMKSSAAYVQDDPLELGK